MRLPLVSRGRYEDAIARLKQRDAEYADLFVEYRSLKLKGAEMPEPKPVLERKEPDLIQQAIARAAGNSSALRALMLQEVARSKRLGMDDDDIISHIERGIPDEFGIPA